MSKFITISNDPSCYGSEFDPKKLAGLNDKITTAANSAGVRVVLDSDGFAGDRERENGNKEIDWFTIWCGRGYRYSVRQWEIFFRSK